MVLFYEVNNEGTEQTARMRRLICVLVVCMWNKQVFSYVIVQAVAHNIMKLIFLNRAWLFHYKSISMTSATGIVAQSLVLHMWYSPVMRTAQGREWLSTTLCSENSSSVDQTPLMRRTHRVFNLLQSILKVSQGRKKHMARPGLEPRTSRRPCEHSDHWATEPHGRPLTISPCLIRFVPESARNHAGTDETVPLLLAARARTHTEPPNVTGEEKIHGPTGTRTQDHSQTVRALWSLSYRA